MNQATLRRSWCGQKSLLKNVEASSPTTPSSTPVVPTSTVGLRPRSSALTPPPSLLHPRSSNSAPPPSLLRPRSPTLATPPSAPPPSLLYPRSYACLLPAFHFCGSSAGITVPADRTTHTLRSLTGNTKYDAWVVASTIGGPARGANHSFITKKYGEWVPTAASEGTVEAVWLQTRQMGGKRGPTFLKGRDEGAGS